MFAFLLIYNLTVGIVIVMILPVVDYDDQIQQRTASNLIDQEVRFGNA